MSLLVFVSKNHRRQTQECSIKQCLEHLNTAEASLNSQKSLTKNRFPKIRLDLDVKKFNAHETVSVTFFYILSGHGKITNLNSIDCVYGCVCVLVLFFLFLAVSVVVKPQFICKDELFMGSGKGKKSKFALYCISFESTSDRQ